MAKKDWIATVKDFLLEQLSGINNNVLYVEDVGGVKYEFVLEFPDDIPTKTGISGSEIVDINKTLDNTIVNVQRVFPDGEVIIDYSFNAKGKGGDVQALENFNKILKEGKGMKGVLLEYYDTFPVETTLPTTLENDITIPNTPEGIDTPTSVVDEVDKLTPLADDVKEVTNDFTFNKFAEKQRTADSVIFRELEDGTIELLTIQRKRGPHRSLYALPGGIVESTVLDDEKILQAVIDPGKTFMRENTIHEYFIPFDTKQVVDVGKSANEIFAREGLREAIEEVGIDRTVIKNASTLPVKYERFDWDARAAKGVDVGGIVMLVDNDWVPTAKDDAKSYEWIKLDDVVDGSKELAFGHAEFVEDGFSKFYNNSIFEKSNIYTTYKNKSKYGIDIINQLQNIKKQNSARNVEIIKQANVVREQLGQPLINTNTTSFIDKENREMINSIRSIGYRDIGRNGFTAAQRMSPDIIFYDIMYQALNRDVQTNFIVEEDLVEVGREIAGIGQEPEQSLNRLVKLKPEAQARVINEIRENTLKRYGSNLKMMVNDGMKISPVVNSLYENARSIIYSEDFETVLKEILKEEVEIKVFNQNDETGKVVYDIVGYNMSEAADYATLDPTNSLIQEKGLKEAVDDNLNYLSYNYEEIAQPLNNLRERNNLFYKNTFPEEVYMDPIQWWKSSGQNFPEAALDIKKLKRGPGNTLIGMTYHGSQGLNTTGMEVIKILKDEIPKLNVSKTTQEAVQQFDNAWNRYLNKIATENNLDWLDPTKNRGNNLRGSVMYTTNNPGLAASYALGGNAGDLVTSGRNRINEAIHTLINNKDIFDVNNIKKLNRINSKLNKYGLQIVPNWQDMGEVAMRTLTNEPPFLVSPIIMQNNFKVPVDKMLHTDMPITRQLNNPSIRKAVNAALKNTGPEVLLNKDEFLNNALDLLIGIARNDKDGYTGINNLEFATSEDQAKVLEALVEARDNPNSPNRKYIKEYFINNMGYTTDLKTNRIKNIIDTGEGSWNDIVLTFIHNSGFGQQINSNKLQQAIGYLTASDATYYDPTPRSFENFNITAGEVLFDMEFNNFTKDKEVVKLNDLIDFIKQADVSIVGGNYAATNDLMYLKKIIEYFDNNPELSSKFWKAYSSMSDWKTMQKKAVTSADGTVMYFVDVNVNVLRDAAKTADNTIFMYSSKIDPKNNLRELREEFRPLVDGKYEYKFRKEVNEAVLANSGVAVGKDKELTLFLEQVTGLDYYRSNINSIGDNAVLADYIGMKSLAEGGIEVTMGTGGGRAGSNFHDNFYIVDPGNKFGVSEPKLSQFITNAVEFDIETLKVIEDVTLKGTSFADLDDNQIRKIAEFIPLEQVINSTEITTAQKERWSNIYNSLNITDNRFTSVAGINPKPLDGIFLNLNQELQEMITYQALHGDLKAPIIQNHIAKLYGEVATQVDPQDVIPVMKSTGLLRMLGNGLDLYDAAVFAPVLIDMIMSRTTGVGSTTETIGGSIADVAMDVYDPSKEDTVFEATWGSPEDPRTLAGGISNSIDIIKDPIVEVAKENPLLSGMFNSIKEGAISALTTVKNGLGLNEWIYNVKRDMYVSSALKEMGYDGKGNNIPSGLVKKLEGEYESYLPNNEDKYGRPLDVGDTSNMPDYTKGVFRR